MMVKELIVITLALMLLAPLLPKWGPAEEPSHEASFLCGMKKPPRISGGGMVHEEVISPGLDQKDDRKPQAAPRRPRPLAWTHEGDLIVEDEVWYFSSMEVYLTGNLIIRGEGMVVLDRTYFVINQSEAYQFGIYVEDLGQLKAFDSQITSDYPFNLTCRDSSSVILECSEARCSIVCLDTAFVRVKENSTARTVVCRGGTLEVLGNSSTRVEMEIYGSASGQISVEPGFMKEWDLDVNTTLTDVLINLRVKNSTITRWSFCLGGHTDIDITDSEVGVIVCQDLSHVEISETSFDWVICRSHADVEVSGSTGGTLACIEDATVEVSSSTLSLFVELRGPLGEITLEPGAYEDLTISGVHLLSTVVENWDLSLVDFTGTIRDSSLRGISCSGGTDLDMVSSSSVSLYLEGTSRAHIYNSTLGGLTCCEQAKVWLYGTAYSPSMLAYDQAEIYIFWYVEITALLAGEPVGGADISIYLVSNSSLVASGTTASDGRAGFILMGKKVNETGDWPVGAYRVEAKYGVYSEEEEIEVNSNTALELELGFEIKVHCVDGDGEDLPLALVVVEPGNLTAETGGDGWATVEGVKAENLTLRVLVWGVEVAHVNLAWGVNFTGDITLDLLPCAVYDLLVRVVDVEGKPVAKAMVSLLWLNLTGIITLLTDSTGWVVFENIPATHYRLKVVKEGYEDKTEYVNLTEDDQTFEVVLEPRQERPEEVPWWMSWPVLTTMIVGSIIGVMLVAVVASLKRRG